MADDGHTINVGPVTIGEPPARPPVDTDIIGTVALVWRANGADATADAIESLCDEVDRLRAENTALAAALADIAGMRRFNDGTARERWVADAECMLMRGRCWEHLGKPDGGPEEWCHTCVAEVAWSAWKLGVLR